MNQTPFSTCHYKNRNISKVYTLVCIYLLGGFFVCKQPLASFGKYIAYYGVLEMGPAICIISVCVHG